VAGRRWPPFGGTLRIDLAEVTFIDSTGFGEVFGPRPGEAV
jgi:hypothetical protein